MSSPTLIFCSLLYLALLFLIAEWAEQRSQRKQQPSQNPYLYALSLAVYCTAWTFYGSVGRAATNGVEFLATYIGPTLGAPLWWIAGRKIIRICKEQRITNLADFVSARYGKSRGLGVFVTGLCVVGMIPYISIQLKAITASFSVLTAQPSASALTDQALLITVLVAFFTILFGTRKLSATEAHPGLMTAIAVESIVKLVAFLAVGVFVTFGLFDGPGDIFGRALARPDLRDGFTFGAAHTSADWFWTCLLSMPAVLLLPRQFQVFVVENTNENNVKKAAWLFPLYLLLINLFVLPVAFGGKLLLGHLHVDADSYVLTLPLQAGQKWLALLAYLGGFSAATSMIIVETIALSVMISNNVVMPLLVSSPRWQSQFGALTSVFVINSRRLAIAVLLLLAYSYYRIVSQHYSLVSVGQISFAAVLQFAPAVFGGIFWRQGSQRGAWLGLIVGTLIWAYTLIVPTLIPVGLLPGSWLTEGPFGLYGLRPQALFGLTTLNPLAQAVFWSLLTNVVGYVVGSLNWPQSSLDHQQAILFVDAFRNQRSSPVLWRGQALVSDLRGLLVSFFSDSEADRLLKTAHTDTRLAADLDPLPVKSADFALPDTVALVEKTIAGAVGSASARMLIAQVTQEERLTVSELVKVLKDSQQLMETNKALRQQSDELQTLTQKLQQANQQLQQADRHKDEFLSTITHEIRTPITSVRALTEILFDNTDLEADTRQQFLGTIIRESERLTRLINQVLDLERIESGRMPMAFDRVLLNQIILDSIESLQSLTREKNATLEAVGLHRPLVVLADRDRITQVCINLISNAIKFCNSEHGHIIVRLTDDGGVGTVHVTDNGIGIEPELQSLIFEKFYQVGGLRKAKGSGLGLTISKKIIELHNGNVSVESQPGNGATFTFRLPLIDY